MTDNNSEPTMAESIAWMETRKQECETAILALREFDPVLDRAASKARREKRSAIQDELDSICNALAAMRAVSGEPRQWKVVRDDGAHWDFLPDCSRAEAEAMFAEYALHFPTRTFTLIPLYAFPSPPARDV